MNHEHRVRTLMSRLGVVERTHNSGVTLNESNLVYRQFVCDLLELLYFEDLGKVGDITTQMLNYGRKKSRAVVFARQNGRLSGLEEIDIFLKYLADYGEQFGEKVKIVERKADGEFAFKNDVIAVYEGFSFQLLSLERTILNVIGRMSGIASYADAMVKKCGNKVLVVPTRKTFWGLMDKKACFDGHGGTHRLTLSDAILVKDNHIKLSGGLDKILRLLLSKKKVKFVEIEAATISEVRQILRYKSAIIAQCKVPFFILLDNMPPFVMREAVNMIRGAFEGFDVYIEASGGIDLHNVNQYAEIGVDVISSGSITHSSSWFDVSMEFNA